ncbi:MAG: KpsF/GutQ family sugar-phosphate isomerase [Synergistaceae bacterium]|jgi:arabinose-5-phosphate isomerase|nr:KpsF/GutQ family sugar-phosphate isomerase [Synergistaceae bacterium]
MESEKIGASEKNAYNMLDEELLSVGRDVILTEARAIEMAAAHIGYELVHAARLVASCRGRVVVSGLGKSGHVGRKMAATLASLGVPAFFLHAAEASHGDLGMVCPDDIGLLISNSGETDEVLAILPYFRRIGARVIAMTGKPSSTLAQNSDISLNTGVEREADPLGLAPTSSTSVQMAVGDAIAGISTKLRGLKPEDFAMFHPGGSLGRSLLTRVSDLMGKGESLPVTRMGSSVREALFEITSKGYGATVVVDECGDLCGIFTDGDLRRLMERMGVTAMDVPVEEGMTSAPRTIDPEKLATEAVRIMEELEISVLVAVDGRKPSGIIHIHEILKAGVS